MPVVIVVAAFMILPGVAVGQSTASVSVSELRHSVPGKAIKFLEKAFNSVDQDHMPTMSRLQEGLKDPEVAPYAFKAMGAKHMDAGMYKEAIQEFTEALRTLEWDASAHALLAYALYGSGQAERARPEVARSLMLNRMDPVANLVAGLLLIDAEADLPRPREPNSKIAQHLHLASEYFVGARVILAGYYRGIGETAGAAHEMKVYRSSQSSLPEPARARIDHWLKSRNLAPQ